MKKLSLLILFSLLASSLICCQNNQQNKNLTGIWEGYVGSPGSEVRLVYRISIQGDSALHVVHDSPDFGFKDIPVSKATFQNNKLFVEIGLFGAEFEGEFKAKENIIEGRYRHNSPWIPLILKRVSPDPSALMNHMIPRINAAGKRQTDYRYQQPTQVNDGLQTDHLSSVGMDTSLINDLMRFILQEKYPNIHSLVIVKKSKLVLDEYFYGYDERKVHPIHSVTKGVTSTLVGIAKDQGLITDLDTPMCEFFPEYSDLLCEGEKRQITLYHFLSMTAGFDWDETSYSYYDQRNNLVAMKLTSDWLKYLFERPLKYQPGEKFTYNTGIMMTLEVLLGKVAKMPTNKFAEKLLFDPLKISHYKWDNIAGLHLQPRDMAKIGYLFLHKGNFDGKQIITGDWYDRFSARMQNCDGAKYWNHWGPNVHFVENQGLIGYSAGGFGGQLIFGFPDLDLVVVFTAGNFLGSADQHEMLDKFILPAVLAGAAQEQLVSSNQNIRYLKNFHWSPKMLTNLGCIKGCLDYLKIPVSDAWLYGGTGYAFVINIHQNVQSQSIGVWNNSHTFELGKNLGYTIETISGHKSRPDFSSLQQTAWEKMTHAIDSDLPCWGFHLDVPESYVIYGYDDRGYYFKGVNCEAGFGPKCWRELGDSDIGWLELHIVKPCEQASDQKTIKDALQFALDISESPEKWIYAGYKSGPAGYDLWIEALKENRADAFGTAYNAAAWAECRKYAVEFLKGTKDRLSEDFHPFFDQAIAQYKIVSDNLNKVSREFPYQNTYSWQRNENMKDENRRKKAIKYLEVARDAEMKGLEVLKKIVERL